MMFFKASAISNDPKMHCTLSRKGKKVHKLNLLAQSTWDKVEVYPKFITLYQDNFEFIQIILISS